MAAAGATLVGEADGDEAGDNVASAGDTNDDGYADILVGACRHDDTDVGTGVTYLVLGPVGGQVELADAGSRLLGDIANSCASYLADGVAGDLDGDGTDDVVVGAPGRDPAGANYVLYGPLPTGDVGLASADVVVLGEPSTGAVANVQSVGDLDGDGWRDLVFGDLADDSVATDSGAAYVVYGPLPGDMDLSTADAKLTGSHGGDDAGEAVSAGGDTDGDGLDDLLVGVPWDTWPPHPGTAYLHLGPVSGVVRVAAADASFAGPGPGGSSGQQAVILGDLDADGYDDMLINCSTSNTEGGTCMVRGPASGPSSLGDADAQLEHPGPAEGVTGLSGPGDIDQDGFDDILVGSSQAEDAGAAYLVLGPVSGTVSLADADGTWTGETRYDNVGGAVAGAGDVDADGYPDWLVGATGYDVGTDEWVGAAYLIFGGP